MEKNIFTKVAQGVATATGSPWASITAVSLIIIWAASGPLFDFSNTWQLVVNTGTTIITFLMVFLIQNTQNRDTYALQLKLDELIRATKEANNALMDIEELDEKDLRRLRDYYEKLACEARKRNNIKDDKDFPLNDLIKEGKLGTETRSEMQAQKAEMRAEMIAERTKPFREILSGKQNRLVPQ